MKHLYLYISLYILATNVIGEHIILTHPNKGNSSYLVESTISIQWSTKMVGNPQTTIYYQLNDRDDYIKIADTVETSSGDQHTFTYNWKIPKDICGTNDSTQLKIKVELKTPQESAVSSNFVTIVNNRKIYLADIPDSTVTIGTLLPLSWGLVGTFESNDKAELNVIIKTEDFTDTLFYGYLSLTSQRKGIDFFVPDSEKKINSFKLLIRLKNDSSVFYLSPEIKVK